MALPFAPETWVERTAVAPPGGCSVQAGVIDQYTGHILIGGASDLVSGGGFTFKRGFLKRSTDSGATWITEYDTDTGGGAPTHHGYIQTVFSIHAPNATHFYRFRVRRVDGAFPNPAVLYPGGVFLERSSIPVGPEFAEGVDYLWSPVQTFYEWPQIVHGGSIGCSFSASPLLIGGVPWMLTCMSLTTAAGGAHISEYVLWRSTDYGSTWERVYNITGQTPGLSDPAVGSYFARGPDGALHARGSRSFDGGATWAAVATIAAGWPDLAPVFHPGATASGIKTSTLTGSALFLISCDNGDNWQSTENILFGSSLVPLVAYSKLSPQEVLVVSDAQTYWSNNGGETFAQVGQVPFVGAAGVLGVPFMSLLPNGRPFVVMRGGDCGYSTDVATGTWATRTTCPLASAGIGRAGPLNLCGAPIIPQCEE